MKNSIDNKNSKKSKKSRMAVNNTATQNKYKQSNKNSQKNKSAKKNFLLKFIFTVLIIVVAIILVFVSGVFNISEIIVENNRNISEQQIISFSQIENGMNIFSISKEDVINNVKENSYVENVQFKRCFPDKIKLIVEERELEYVVQFADGYIYINRQGYILEISAVKPDVPVIFGFSTDFSNIQPNERLNENDLHKMNMVIKIMNTAENNNIKNLITSIDVSDEKNYTIYLDGEQKKAYLGDGQELNTRFLYIKSILKEQKGKPGEIFVNVDLNSEYVYFRENI